MILKAVFYAVIIHHYGLHFEVLAVGRYHAHTVKFTLSKSTVHWFLKCPELYSVHLYLIPGHLISPDRSSAPISSLSLSLFIPAPGNHSSVFCFYGFASDGHFTQIGSDNVWTFVTDFFPLACLHGASMLCHVSVPHSFTWLNNVPLCGYHILFIFPSIDG